MPLPNATTPPYAAGPEMVLDPTDHLDQFYGRVDALPNPDPNAVIRPTPDPPPRPSLFRLTIPLRQFGQWLRQPFAGAHNVVVQNVFTAKDPTLPFYTEVPAVNRRNCWDTEQRGSY